MNVFISLETPVKGKIKGLFKRRNKIKGQKKTK
jgi:hypothetical protein